eukprot:TRINITY_DN4313_c0_g1_i2.p1 TRINITY_DN4313_c0_g1~~TRINITY_DN4313_c0_g1_i2.p1  ORF type:complete len:408 (+),score=150.22 TRINITY_DN4313_c0_g1_i2:130-1224(+)
MLACCMRDPALEKGTETLLKRRSFQSPDLRDLGEKDLHTELTYDTLKIVADPTRIFRLEQCIGTMHLFEVWDARDVRDNKRLMVKIMTKETRVPEKSNRQEDALSAQAIYNLDCSVSAGVAAVYGLYEQYPTRVGLNFFATKVWYVQDYAGPSSLSDYLVRHHKHPKEPKVSQGMADEGRIAVLMQQLLEAIHEAHQASVILRNLCTMNVFVSETGEKLKIHDFWYCVELPAEDEDGGPEKCFKSTVWAGYPSCLAPEALLGNYYQAGDIWSAGLVAYELACGANPFTAIAVELLLEGISLQVAQKLSRRVADASVMLDMPQKSRPWSGAFQAFVKSMLNRDHAGRPSAAELLEHPFLQQARQQ